MSELLHTKQNHRSLARRTRAAGGVLGILLVATGCMKIEYNGNDDEGSELPTNVAGASPNNTHTTPPQPDNLPEYVTYDPNFTFTKKSFCSWKFGTRPVPISDTHPVKVRVDNRCTNMGNSDTHLDKDIPVYKEPIDSGDTIATIVDTNEVTLDCYRRGAMVVNLRDRSDIWLKVTSNLFEDSGFLPDLSLGGGFSIGQLEGLGVAACKPPHPGK